MVSLLRGAEAQPAFRADENYRRMHPADHRAIMRSDSPDCQYQTWQRGELLPVRGLVPGDAKVGECRRLESQSADVRPDWQSVESQFPALVTI